MKKILILFMVMSIYSLGQPEADSLKSLEKFEPSGERVLLFIGQDMEAIGGLANYDNGYLDHFAIPAGLTLYTNWSPGENSFGFITKGNDGIETIANWGAGDTCARCYMEDPRFENTMLAIGLSMVNHEKEIANGTHDDLIEELASWIKQTNRPVFLRIGYEFDGWDWNNYSRKNYLKSWQRIHSKFNQMQVENVAFVWQSKGTGSNQEVLEKWYPGDDLVDWVGYSYFGNPDEEMIAFARRHKKPVFIAEATPVREADGLYFDSRLSNQEIAKRTWENWFKPFFETIERNRDVIKAISYINCNWTEQPMWKINPIFKNVDSRIQASEYISERWKEEIESDKFLMSSKELFKHIRFKK